jgi:hypothetical protein
MGMGIDMVMTGATTFAHSTNNSNKDWSGCLTNSKVHRHEDSSAADTRRRRENYRDERDHRDPHVR